MPRGRAGEDRSMIDETSGVDDSQAILVARLAATLLSSPDGSFAHKEIDDRITHSLTQRPNTITNAAGAVEVARELVDEAYRQCPVLVTPIKPLDITAEDYRR